MICAFYSVKQSSPYYIQIEGKSDTDTSLQLFFDIGKPFLSPVTNLISINLLNNESASLSSGPKDFIILPSDEYKKEPVVMTLSTSKIKTLGIVFFSSFFF